MIKFVPMMVTLFIATAFSSASIAASEKDSRVTPVVTASQPLLIAYNHAAERAAAKSQRQVRRRTIRRNQNYRQKLRNDHRRYEQSLVRHNHH